MFEEFEIYKIKNDSNTLKKIEILEQEINEDFRRRSQKRKRETLKKIKDLNDYIIF